MHGPAHSHVGARVRVLGGLLLALAAGAFGGCNANAGRAAAASSIQPGLWQQARPQSPHPAYKQQPIRCDPCAARPFSKPIGEVYGGGTVLASPAVGGSLEFGQVFARSAAADWSFEIEGGVQALDAELYGNTSNGTWAQAQGGVKASFNPLGRGHPTARAGIAWFRTTEPTEFVDEEGDYVGLYAGVGYEVDVSPRFTTGPEISVMAAAKEGGSDPVYVPQFSWHFLYNF
jgi:hypothetical protein